MSIKKRLARLPITLFAVATLLLWVTGITLLSVVLAAAIFVFYELVFWGSPSRRDQFRAIFVEGAIQAYTTSLLLALLGTIAMSLEERRRRRGFESLTLIERFLLLIMDRLSGHGRPGDETNKQE